MTRPGPVLHFLCGKLASGKSTLARRIAREQAAILFSEDLWLSRLYPGEIATFPDYLEHSARLRSVIAPHAEVLLRAGVPVVFDFAGNTPRERGWVRTIFEAAGAGHLLHSIVASDALCKRQLRRRNQELPEGAKATTEEEFDAITRYFLPPGEEEGFRVLRHEAGRDG